jgi:D-alanine-D-alanine ligase
VFNLVESLLDAGRLIYFFPGLLDALAMPYTGASAEALFLTSNKLLAKQRLQDAGLPTPAWMWITDSGGLERSRNLTDAGVAGATWIVKSVWEHASLGLGEHSLITRQGVQTMAAVLKTRAPELGGACFAETFVEGREFNISILDGPSGPRVLPPAEIVFSDFKTGKPCIVDYRAKWDTESFEYHHTPRCFKFAARDRSL